MTFFDFYDPEWGALHYHTPRLPEGATVTDDGVNLVFEWTPTSSQAGIHFIPVYATDEGSPPMTTAIVYQIIVPPPPPLEIAPIEPVLVDGGAEAVMEVSYAQNTCYEISVTPLLPEYWWREGSPVGILIWYTEADDFGLYDVEFELRDISNPSSVTTEVGRFIVQFSDDFASLSGYGTHEVHLDWCC
jgi:hypothetical protein